MLCAYGSFAIPCLQDQGLQHNITPHQRILGFLIEDVVAEAGQLVLQSRKLHGNVSQWWPLTKQTHHIIGPQMNSLGLPEPFEVDASSPSTKKAEGIAPQCAGKPTCPLLRQTLVSP